MGHRCGNLTLSFEFGVVLGVKWNQSIFIQKLLLWYVEDILIIYNTHLKVFLQYFLCYARFPCIVNFVRKCSNNTMVIGCNLNATRAAGMSGRTVYLLYIEFKCSVNLRRVKKINFS